MQDYEVAVAQPRDLQVLGQLKVTPTCVNMVHADTPVTRLCRSPALKLPGLRETTP